MSITLLNAPGGLFNRLGRIFYALGSANSYLGSGDISAGGLKAVGVSTTSILGEFLSTLQNVPDGITQNRDSVREALSSWKTYLKTLAENTIIEMAHADVTLVVKDLEHALKELIRQMANGNIYSPNNDVDANTVSATIASDSLYTNTGNGVLISSVVRTDGRNNEHVLAEVLEAICDNDSQQGGTERSETFTITGEPAVSDKLAWNWPGGSGASVQVTSIDADLNASGNLLYGGNFDAFTTTNQPDYFGAALVGAYGTDILEEATVVYRSGGKSLEFIGTGGTPLSSIAQKFDVASPAAGTSGTSSALKPNTVYGVNCFIRKSAGLLAGNFKIRLLDQAGSPAVVADDAATDNSLSIAHGSITTSFAAFGGFFRTPKVHPSTGYQLNLQISTALTSGESVYVDDLAMCEAVQLYTGGPYVAIFSGSTNWLLGDKKTITIANNAAGDYMQYFERCFDMRDKGLQLPSDTGGTETVADSLIA